MEGENSSPHIVIVPTPGIGHLIPLVEFAKRILEISPFQISFVVPTQGPPTQHQRSVLAALPEERVTSTFLPPINLDNEVPPNAKIETIICLTLARSLPALRDHLSGLQGSQHNLVALVVDLFATDAFDVGLEFGMKLYLFFTSSGMCLSFLLHLPQLDAQVSCEFRDMHEPVQLPGCTPIHGKDLVDSVQDRTDDAYKWLLHHCKRYKLAEGILVNSFNELEEGALKILSNHESHTPIIYPVGPLVQTRLGDDEKVDGSDCLKWLDEQPWGSVLFVSFGSGGTLSYNQIIELAHGLEMSRQKFLWVLRSPNDEAFNATYFSVESDHNNPTKFLPKGFLDRTKEQGLVIPMWAPQIKVLSNAAIGGFLSHCGWNSILESVVNGVPLIAWPLYAEQKMNTIMLIEGMNVAIRPNVGEKGLISRGEIAKIVKGLMESEEKFISKN
ncbi:Hydroquinone glucosyltransferase [Bienertia sinuspersici]